MTTEGQGLSCCKHCTADHGDVHDPLLPCLSCAAEERRSGRVLTPDHEPECPWMDGDPLACTCPWPCCEHCGPPIREGSTFGDGRGHEHPCKQCQVPKEPIDHV